MPKVQKSVISMREKIISEIEKIVKTKDIFVWQDFDDNYMSQVFLRPTKLENTLVKGIIKSNLYISALKSGMPENTLLEMINLLGFSVDFQREIREGDAFEVLFTKEIDVLKNIAIQTWDSKISNICTTLHTCVETIVKQYPDMKSTVRR